MKWNILLVEDDEISAFLSTRLLEKKGRCSLLEVAKNGQEALDYLYNCRSTLQFPDLILLDVNMPIMDGFEFLRQYANLDLKTRERIPVILLSTDPGRLAESRSDFILTQIAKPLTIEKVNELFDTLDEYAQKRLN